jgi:hypothetical protein
MRWIIEDLSRSIFVRSLEKGMGIDGKKRTCFGVLWEMCPQEVEIYNNE